MNVIAVNNSPDIAANQYLTCKTTWCQTARPWCTVTQMQCGSCRATGGHNVHWTVDGRDVYDVRTDDPYMCSNRDCYMTRPYLGGVNSDQPIAWCHKCETDDRLLYTHDGSPVYASWEVNRTHVPMGHQHPTWTPPFSAPTTNEGHWACSICDTFRANETQYTPTAYAILCKPKPDDGDIDTQYQWCNDCGAHTYNKYRE